MPGSVAGAVLTRRDATGFPAKALQWGEKRVALFAPLSAILPSAQDFLHESPMHVGQAVVAALEAVREPRVVEAEQVQQRGVQVVDVDRVGDDVEAEIVGLAVRVPGLARRRRPARG